MRTRFATDSTGHASAGHMHAIAVIAAYVAADGQRRRSTPAAVSAEHAAGRAHAHPHATPDRRV
ncbi:MAG: hypothetical protein JWP87_5180, partial [Labilithrix sp.]|nr:hypothetical protein [Labilithrix sp.]